MIFALSILLALWPTLALAGEASMVPMPGSWWELVLGAVAVLLSGGYGSGAILQKLRGTPEAPPEVALLRAKVEAMEEHDRAARDQAAASAREKRVTDIDARLVALEAAVHSIQATIRDTSAATSATISEVRAGLKRLEGGAHDEHR